MGIKSDKEISDKALAGKLEAIAKSAPGEQSVVLREAAQRLLRSRNPQFCAVSARQVCARRPTQFEGVLQETDDNFFIRYQNRSLTLHVDDHLVEYIELSETEHHDPERISFDEVRALLANTIELPDRCQ